jgi:hypothetical protein
MGRSSVQINQLETAEPKCVRRRTHFGDARDLANHVTLVVERPAIHATRAPTDTMQRVRRYVVHDRTDVIVDGDHPRRRHRLGCDAIDN